MNIFNIASTSLLVEGQHSFFLVVTSIAIAVFASFMAFEVASRAAVSISEGRRQILISIGSIALGVGVWSMHFIGMLALELCTDVSFGFHLTLLSLLPAIAASWVALHFLTKKTFLNKQLFISGSLVGAGIGSMHYIGMAAMEMAVLLRYDLGFFILSIVVAIFFACLSLLIKFRLESISRVDLHPMLQNFIASLVMGCAISGMHYTGMIAARFVLPPGIELSQQGDDISTFLAISIAVVTAVSIILVLGTNLIFKYKDITALAIANETRLKATINTSLDGIITINRKGYIISVNDAVENMLGWSEKDLLNQNITKIIPHEHSNNHDNYISEYLRTKQAKIIGRTRDVDAVSLSGERIPVRLGLGHVHLEHEDLFVGYLFDLRDQQRMQKEIVENEAKFRSLLSNIPGIVYRCIDQAERPMIYVSDEIEKVTGFCSSDFLGLNAKLNFADFILEEDLANILEIINASKTTFNIEYRIKDKFGNTKWMLGYGKKVKQGEQLFIDGFIMDITSRKNMEEALRVEKNNAQQAAESRASFMANMSHEIRTPMNAIIGFSDLLREEEMPEAQKKFVCTIHQSAQSLLYILNDVLDSAKLDKGELTLEISTFSLLEVMDAVISTFGLQAHKKGIELSLNIAPALHDTVTGAPERLRQVLLNIVGNAVKFTDKGKVQVSVKKSANNLVIFEIKDNGIGMKEEQLNRIFDPFVQADASMSRKYGGTGLGTTISKQLVELMGGTIEVDSEYGSGTSVSINLTLPPANEDKVNNKNLQLLSKEKPLSILVADDVQQNLDLLYLLLNKVGHSVECVSDGQQALDKMALNYYDVVLMDLQMPVMDGLDAAAERRKLEHKNGLNATPIVALTASVLEQDQLAAKQAGMNGFANKPIVLEALIAEISRVIGHGENTHEEHKVMPSSIAIINKEKGTNLWGSVSLLKNEISKYIHNTSILNSLNNYITQLCSLDDVVAHLHKDKGICGNLGLEKCYQQIQIIEGALRFEELSDIPDLMHELKKDFQDVDKILSACGKEHNDFSERFPEQSTASMTAALIELQKQTKQNTYKDEELEQMLLATSEEYKTQAQKIAEHCYEFEFSDATDLIKLLLDKLTPTEQPDD